MNLQTPNTANRYTMKGLLTAGMIIAFIIPMAIIMNLVSERQNTQKQAIDNIAQSYARPQTLAGPYLIIPILKTETKDKETVAVRHHKFLLPQELIINGNIKTDKKKRGIYEVPVFSAQIAHKGFFNLELLNLSSNEKVDWAAAMIAYSISDARGFDDSLNIFINGQNLQMDKNLQKDLSLINNAIYTNIDLSQNQQKYTFDMNMTVKGSQSLKMTPLGNITKVDLKSDYLHPSFEGNFLPVHDIDKNGFKASFKIGNINRAFPQVWHNMKYQITEDAFGVRFLEADNHYRNTERTLKYAILFIGLTFGFFFLLEIIQGKKVHPIQYLLVGLALIIFYTLLLSIGEYTDFKCAYSISTIATVGLITIYCRQLFQKWSSALLIGLFLLLLYVFIFIIIQMEEYNLLAGSIGLFILIAVAMYLSKKVDWYKSVIDNNADITPKEKLTFPKDRHDEL